MNSSLYYDNSSSVKQYIVFYCNVGILFIYYFLLKLNYDLSNSLNADAKKFSFSQLHAAWSAFLILNDLLKYYNFNTIILKNTILASLIIFSNEIYTKLPKILFYTKTLDFINVSSIIHLRWENNYFLINYKNINLTILLYNLAISKPQYRVYFYQLNLLDTVPYNLAWRYEFHFESINPHLLYHHNVKPNVSMSTEYVDWNNSHQPSLFYRMDVFQMVLIAIINIFLLNSYDHLYFFILCNTIIKAHN